MNIKLRFWQKSYIIVLILFLLSLNIGIFSLAYFTYNRSFESTKELYESEQYYIAVSFERDLKDLNSAGAGADERLLMQSYCSFYAKSGTMLDFIQNGSVVVSSFDTPHREIGANAVAVEKTENGRRLLISSYIDENKYTLVYGKSLDDLDNEFRSLMLTYALTAVGISSVLAVCLYFVLRRLSTPLEKLQSATEAISVGDHTVRADETGGDEFAELGKSFNGMVDKINAQIEDLKLNAEQKQRLVDNLAHELRTPLTSIYGYAEYLRNAKTDDDDKIECAMYIMSESERLQRISERLLDTAYIRNGEIKKEPLSLRTLLYDTAEKLGQRAYARGVTLTVEGEDATINGDGVLLSMLFYNLAENAIKACSDSGSVTLSCRDEGDEVIAKVHDTGKGMTAEQLKHITEPFYRTDRSRSRADGGAGLGLALCKQIAESHNAGLIFESEPGKGTNVSVIFTKKLAIDDKSITT